MIVSTTFASNVLVLVLDALDVVGAGGGAVTPLIGISPARTVTDISPVSAIAITKRFILSLLCD